MIVTREVLRSREVDQLDYFKVFSQQVCNATAVGAEVLDVGCGSRLHPSYAEIRNKAVTYWGCDPDTNASSNRALTQFFHGDFESIDFEGKTFDLILSTYVLEHISAAEEFFCKARQLLKPGGVFAFLTPNAQHPFCTIVRVVEMLRLKKLFRRQIGQDAGGMWRVNDYPAWYHANRVRDIERLAREADFVECRTMIIHGGWQYYFPRVLRFIPKLYDHCAARWLPQRQSILLGFLSA